MTDVLVAELRAAAVREIRRFAGADVQRPQAAALLELWQHGWQLTRVSREAVLREFPEPSWDDKPFADYIPEPSALVCGSSPVLKAVR